MKAKFIRHKDARRTLGISPLDRRSFEGTSDFLNWVWKVFLPYYYGTSDPKEIGTKVLNERLDEDRPGVKYILPPDLLSSLEEIGQECNNKNNRNPMLGLSLWTILEMIENKSGVGMNFK